MATQISGKSALLMNSGLTVVRAAAAVPSNTTGTIFNITGGKVLITNFVGEVTTVFSSAGATFTINSVNTATSGTTAIGAASSSQTNTAVGNLASAPTFGGAFAFASALVDIPPFILKPGTIQVVTSAAITGAMSWLVSYVPLDPGAAVTAA